MLYYMMFQTKEAGPNATVYPIRVYYLILIIGKLAGPPGSHLRVGEVRISSTTFKRRHDRHGLVLYLIKKLLLNIC